jgi:hypothetical protein
MSPNQAISANDHVILKCFNIQHSDLLELRGAIGVRYLNEHKVIAANPLRTNPLFWSWLAAQIDKNLHGFCSHFLETKLKRKPTADDYNKFYDRVNDFTDSVYVAYHLTKLPTVFPSTEVLNLYASQPQKKEGIGQKYAAENPEMYKAAIQNNEVGYPVKNALNDIIFVLKLSLINSNLKAYVDGLAKADNDVFVIDLVLGLASSDAQFNHLSPSDCLDSLDLCSLFISYTRMLQQGNALLQGDFLAAHFEHINNISPGFYGAGGTSI